MALSPTGFSRRIRLSRQLRCAGACDCARRIGRPDWLMGAAAEIRRQPLGECGRRFDRPLRMDRTLYRRLDGVLGDLRAQLGNAPRLGCARGHCRPPHLADLAHDRSARVREGRPIVITPTPSLEPFIVDAKVLRPDTQRQKIVNHTANRVSLVLAVEVFAMTAFTIASLPLIAAGLAFGLVYMIFL